MSVFLVFLPCFAPRVCAASTTGSVRSGALLPYR